MKSDIIAILGQRQTSADGVVDYCTQLQQKMGKQNIYLELVWLSWKEKGWIRSLTWLWQESQAWCDRWVIAQFTASAWSMLALPVMFVVVVGLLKIRGVKTAIMFHEVQGYPGERLKYKIRRWVQLWTIRTAMKLADRSIFNVNLEQLTWLPISSCHATFIPVGSNIPEPDLMAVESKGECSQSNTKTVAVFGMTSVDITRDEVDAIAFALKQASEQLSPLRLITLGRGSTDAEPHLRRLLEGTSVDYQALGLLKTEEIAQTLASADVLLYVRGEISTRRTTAIAAIACGLPIVAYAGVETGEPIPQAGVILVPEGDTEKLAKELIEVLKNDPLRLELQQRNLKAYREHFSYDAIAQRFLQVLTHE